MKEELLKQNELNFLLQCMKKLNQQSLTLMLEVIWSMSYLQDAALSLGQNSEFLEVLKTLSSNGSDDLVAKASKGLLWQLAQGIRRKLAGIY